MRILLIGAGAVGSVISKLLSKERFVTKIICASKDLKLAKDFINTKDRKIELTELDASDYWQVVKKAKKADLIINASLPNFNKTIMKAALKAKANYQDLCSHLLDLRTPEQLRFHKAFAKAKLVGIINTGIAPGITNLVSRELADKLDKVHEINIRLIEDQHSSEFVFSWSPEVTLDELSSQPLNYVNSRFKLVKAFEGIEEYDFPAPIGARSVVNIYGDEVSTLPRYIKVQNITYKSGGTEIEFSRAMQRLGLFSKKPIRINSKKVVPLEFFSKMAPPVPSPKKMEELIGKGIIKNAIFASVVEGIGIENKRRIKIRNIVVYPDLKEITKKIKGATYISYPTGLAAAVFVRAIAMLQKKKQFGVFPPEALEHDIRKQLLIELEAKGIVVEEQFSRA